ncbi:hypothetical protein JCM11641_005511 [Rhodosporidiobolus odoratus]
MHHPPTGFSAIVSLRPGLTSPPSDPSLQEYAPIWSPPLAESYIEGSDAQIRVYFERHDGLKQIDGLEAYAAFLHVDGGQPFVKIYAVGHGVRTGTFTWFLDSKFGELASTPRDVPSNTVQLKLYPITLKPETELGTGHLHLSDVQSVSQIPIVEFRWTYLSRRLLESYGFVEGPSQSNLSLPSIESATIAVLNNATRIAIELMTPEQRLAFVDRLGSSAAILALLPDQTRDELKRFGPTAGGRAYQQSGRAGYEGERESEYEAFTPQSLGPPAYDEYEEGRQVEREYSSGPVNGYRASGMVRPYGSM